MRVNTFVPVWTLSFSPVDVTFNRLSEILAHNFSFRDSLASRVTVNIHFPSAVILHVQIMRKLAFIAFSALAGLEISAQNSFWVLSFFRLRLDDARDLFEK